MGPGQDTVAASLTQRGISRRDFLKFCGLMAATLALPPTYVPQIAAALEAKRKPVLVWLQFQDCAGNSESMLRSSHPDVAEIVLDTLSWEYHEVLMAGAGKQAEAALERVVREEQGKYLVVVEGAIPTANGGVYCTIGGRTALSIARQVCPGAAAVLAVGACAWDGGIPLAGPTGAVGVETAVPGLKHLINLGGCPHNPANTAAVIVHYLTFGEFPALDRYHRPLFAYGSLIHDQCERRAHYDAGQFVEAWGDEGHRKGWCLYKMGCKGPQATYNCPLVRWNDGTSWPVQAGHGCIGCASPHFWGAMSPFYERLPNVRGIGVDTTAQTVGVAFVGAVAAATAIHGVGALIRSRRADDAGDADDAGLSAGLDPEVPAAPTVSQED